MAMSGGIDSSVSALLLLEQGYELVGVTYRTFDNISHGCMEKEKGCCSVDSLFEAKRMAEQLGFPHHIIDLREEFKQQVISNFIDEYLQGRTPNPCVICNSTIKWGRLIETAAEMGCDYIATGHYARIGQTSGQAGGRYFLKKGIDVTKDQTYFLWMLTQENLAKTLFPLGELTKNQVRHIALEHGYEKLSQKGESQEICFIPDNDYRKFLADNVEHYADKIHKGFFVDTAGKILGEHNGYPNYTIGQRKGLGIALGVPAFVIAIDPKENKVVLGSKEELEGHSCQVSNLNLMKYSHIPEGLIADVKIRYRNAGTAAMLTQTSNRARIEFLSPCDSITPGQSAVFYEGDDVVGGGVIE
ncbi:tRNA-specific 2-thiouridylase MnmA [Bacteroidia bacterium]|nr:tRNA-specific 2-thiouridylase MnmA [Bacteroidia bacterium]